MWATTTLSCKLWSPATVTVTGNRTPFTVSARNTRPRKNINYNYEDEDEDEEINNEQELENLKQEETIDDLDGFKSNETKISGSAVLLALQKASAEKTSKKITKKKKQSNYVKEVRNKGDMIVDYSDVKPLSIKSDWKDRLDELESQINELIHNS